VKTKQNEQTLVTTNNDVLRHDTLVRHF